MNRAMNLPEDVALADALRMDATPAREARGRLACIVAMDRARLGDPREADRERARIARAFDGFAEAVAVASMRGNARPM